MKTSTNCKMVRLVSSVLALLTIGFVNFAQAASASSTFDHSKTGFVLSGVHLTLKCEQCHVDGIFKNTPKDCAGCHSVGTRVGAKPRPINHVPTTAACDTCHISTANFLVKSYKHIGITGGCLTCHNGQSLGVMSKPANHFPTSQPCENCHKNTATFLSWTMDHTGITTGCATCHTTGLYPGVTGLPPLHIPIPAGVECVACHATPPPGVTGSFLGAMYDHTTASPAVAGRCNTCHTGAYTQYGVKGMSPTHIPTAGAQCDTCHTASNTSGYTSFLGATFNHTSTSAACSTCHSGQYASVVSINLATHVPPPAGTTCDTCHTNAITGLPGSLSPTFKNVVVHTTTGGSALPPSKPFNVACSTCHSGSFTGQNATGKGAAHVPTSLDCGTCHTASYLTFAGATYSHAGIAAGSCGTCHQGQYGGVVSINTAVHIPQTAGNACDRCHTNALTGLPSSLTPSFTSPTVIFHQSTLGNPPTGTCTSCHNGSYLSQNALAKNIGHVTTSADCVSCHTKANTANYTSFLGATFSHTPGTYAVFPADGAVASPKCGSCHNGVTATGKVSTHVVTSGDCNSSGCHTKAVSGCPNCLTFYGVTYDHTSSAGIAAYTTFPTTTASPRCDSCHGSTSLGMNTGHIPVNGQDCITCHTPASTGCSNGGLCTTFLGAVYTHIGVAAGTCGTCHKGQYSNVISINTAVHIPQTSGNACDACHTAAISKYNTATPTFLNVKFHANSLGNPPTGTCSSCHSGSYVSEGAQAKNTGHVVTTSDCVSCHTATNTSTYTTFLGASFSHTPGTYAVFPTGVPASPTCSSCHNGTTAKGKSTGHVATTSDCISCHTNTATGCPNCATFLGAGASPHTVANGYAPGTTCVSCHNGSTATGTSADASHIPINGLDCGLCHAAYDGVGSINFGIGASTSGMYAGVTKYGMAHSGLTGTCTSCHSGSYISQGIYGALPKVSNHIPTTITGSLDCTTCHKTLTMATVKVVAGTSDWLAETMNHNGAQGGAPNYCVTCHLSGVTYLGRMQKKSHNGSSTSKDCSSSGCHKPLGSKGSTYSNWD